MTAEAGINSLPAHELAIATLQGLEPSCDLDPPVVSEIERFRKETIAQRTRELFALPLRECEGQVQNFPSGARHDRQASTWRVPFSLRPVCQQGLSPEPRTLQRRSQIADGATEIDSMLWERPMRLQHALDASRNGSWVLATPTFVFRNGSWVLATPLSFLEAEVGC